MSKCESYPTNESVHMCSHMCVCVHNIIYNLTLVSFLTHSPPLFRPFIRCLHADLKQVRNKRANRHKGKTFPNVSLVGFRSLRGIPVREADKQRRQTKRAKKKKHADTGDEKKTCQKTKTRRTKRQTTRVRARVRCGRGMSWYV